VHGLLSAKVKRRVLSLAAAFAVPAAIAAGGLALANPAQASPVHQASVVNQASPGRQAGTGGVSVTIASMSPQYAAPGATVTVTGTVSNRTSQAQAGLEVQLYTSPNSFLTRDGMDSYLAHGEDSTLITAGTQFILPASVPPGGSTSWTASFQVSAEGISEFGVYPVTAQVQDSVGDFLAADQTLLPFWPGQRSAGLLRPLEISWL